MYTDAMDKNTKDIIESLAFIKDHMVTKAEHDAFREEVRAEFSSIRSELKSLRTELDALKQKIENLSGFSKEIDHAFERIAAIEKHLGIEHKLAA
jgi:predicted  nucleic acid-binding Zn-ribbon protein